MRTAHGHISVTLWVIKILVYKYGNLTHLMIISISKYIKSNGNNPLPFANDVRGKGADRAAGNTRGERKQTEEVWQCQRATLWRGGRGEGLPALLSSAGAHH